MHFVVPVAPDAPTAREWAKEELAKAVYHPRENPIDWLMRKLSEWLAELSTTDAATKAGIWIAIGIVLAAIIVAIVVVGPMRKRRLVAALDTSLSEQQLTAENWHEHARRAWQAEDWTATVTTGYRAIVQQGIDRVLIEPLPGLTAREAAISLSERLPDLIPEPLSIATAFDAVNYNDESASREQARATLDLYDALKAARLRTQASRVPAESRVSA